MRDVGLFQVSDLVRVEAVARAVANRLLHEPTIRLRSLSQAHSHSSLQVARELFGLREDPSETGAAQDTEVELAEVHDLERSRIDRRRQQS